MRELHYEFVKGRPEGHQWRVADDNDDFVADFKHEVEAQEYVRYNNDLRDKNTPEHWRY